MDIDLSALNTSQINDIVKITEGSPLYIEDLIRLMTVIPVNSALKTWREREGDDARQYALGRELELLNSDAKQVLLAACISKHAISLVEIEALTGLSEEHVISAIGELQRLFLFPKPRLIEGEQRFEVNLNTRALVLKAMQGSDIYRRIADAEHTLSTDSHLRRMTRSDISAIIRQAVFLVRNRNAVDAETLLCKALEKYVNDPDLLGFLGLVYKAWEPPRVTDAREKFKRASQLKCKSEDMFEHWCRLEIRELEWTKAAEAAEQGLKLLPESCKLKYWAGYSRGRLAKELLTRLHKERAYEEAKKSILPLTSALSDPEMIEPGMRSLKADIYRALVLSNEIIGDVNAIKSHFEKWSAEHPEDGNAQSELDRLTKKFPTLQHQAGIPKI